MVDPQRSKPAKKEIELSMTTAYLLGIVACAIVGLVVYLFYLFLDWALK